MSSNAIDDILGCSKPKEAADTSLTAELEADAAEPEAYRPFLFRSRPQMDFTVIEAPASEAPGAWHGFMYHTLRHPKHEVREGQEFLSFTADGIAVVMQGTGLRAIFLAMMRHTLIEIRAYDGKLILDGSTCITRLEVNDAVERIAAAGGAARLVK